MQTWNLIDKSKWPERGPWDNEPDKAQWTDTATGLICLAVRAHSHWCGYVGLTEDHPLFGKPYDDLGDIEVHGGITYAGYCHGSICHIPEKGQSDHIYWLGFDCAHFGDYDPCRFPYDGTDGTYKDLEYVRREIKSLAAQLAKVETCKRCGTVGDHYCRADVARD